ncbi:MAG: ABC transporter substrate-binding protein [Hyphomicrobiaceae bacterium]
MAVAWPFGADGQQPRQPVIGFLAAAPPAITVEHLAGIRQGLAEAGYVDGQNLSIEHRTAEGVYNRLPGLAADLVARRIDVIIAQSPPAAHAAKAATGTIPIVFGVGIDPVAEGLVTSLARPGGNLTGVTLLSSDLMAKRLALICEMVPQARLIALLLNPSSPNPWISGVEEVARAKGVRLLILKAATPAEIETAFTAMAQQQVQALVIGEDTFLAQREQIADFALRSKIPSIGILRRFAESGGLVSYGTNLKDAYRQIGVYAGQILKGAKPADLPVQQPIKFEMTINLKTAKALGIEIAPLLLARADEVIE